MQTKFRPANHIHSFIFIFSVVIGFEKSEHELSFSLTSTSKTLPWESTPSWWHSFSYTIYFPPTSSFISCLSLRIPVADITLIIIFSSFLFYPGSTSVFYVRIIIPKFIIMMSKKHLNGCTLIYQYYT